MTQQANRTTPEQYLESFDTLGAIQPTAEWTKAVSEAMMKGINKKHSTFSSGMLLPILFFVVLNGFVVLSIVTPTQRKGNSRQQTLQQVQEELFIQVNPVK